MMVICLAVVLKMHTKGTSIVNNEKLFCTVN